jgi:hypothetical protein
MRIVKEVKINNNTNNNNDNVVNKAIMGPSTQQHNILQLFTILVQFNCFFTREHFEVAFELILNYFCK